MSCGERTSVGLPLHAHDAPSATPDGHGPPLRMEDSNDDGGYESGYSQRTMPRCRFEVETRSDKQEQVKRKVKTAGAVRGDLSNCELKAHTACGS